MYNKDLVKPYLANTIFAVLVGFSFLGIKACQPYGNQLEILTYRYNFAFIGVVIVWVLGIFKSAIKDGSAKGKPKTMLLVASVSYIVFMILQVVGLFYTTSVVGSIIFAMTPILVQIIAEFVLKEKSNFKQNIFVVITVGALIYMIVAGSGTVEFNALGLTCLILASVSMAVSSTSMRYVRSDFRPFDITLSICAIGFVLFNVVTVIVGIKNENLGSYFDLMKNPTFVIGTAYLGIGCILFSAQLTSYALSKMPAVNSTIFGNVSTAISIVAGIFILGEPFHTYHFICTVLIVVGVIGVSVYGNKTKN